TPPSRPKATDTSTIVVGGGHRSVDVPDRPRSVTRSAQRAGGPRGRRYRPIGDAGWRRRAVDRSAYAGLGRLRRHGAADRAPEGDDDQRRYATMGDGCGQRRFHGYLQRVVTRLLARPCGRFLARLCGGCGAESALTARPTGLGQRLEAARDALDIGRGFNEA